MAYIEGTSGYDYIIGTSASDTIVGNKGNDFIKDYSGDETYIFNKGDGQDTLVDSSGNDTIKFGQGISLNDLQFFRSDNNLIIRVKDTLDKIDIYYWFDNTRNYKMEKLVFSDGSYITASNVESKVDYNTKVIIASSSNDTVYGGQGSSLIYTMQGSDTIHTYHGNNIIEPASGYDLIYNHGDGNDTIYCSWDNDYIEDYGGNDRYIFEKGDGQDIIYDHGGTDIIKFADGIAKNDVILTQSGDDQVVTFKNSSDKITIKKWFADIKYRIEKFLFADGSVIDNTGSSGGDDTISPGDPGDTSGGTGDISITPTVIGTDGYDYFKGYNGDDVYYAKKYNDRITDYSGNDTYIFYKGDGGDTIQDSSGNDTIVFGPGITQNDISFAKDSSHLLVNIVNSSDYIRIINWFSYDKYKIEQLKFSDGTMITVRDIENIMSGVSNVIEGSDNNDILNGTAINDTIVGKAGNDTIYGYAGNDVLNGGTGNDLIIDSGGNDTYIFNKGDGQDIIQDSNGSDIVKFGSEILQNNLTFAQNDNDLVISMNDTSDKLTLKNWYADVLNKIEKFEFFDGSSLTADQVEDQVPRGSLPPEPPPPEPPSGLPLTPTVIGTDGYDVISGHNGDDIYYAKKSNDRIKDYSGNDTYLINKGDGWDTVTDTSGTDTLRFGAGITKEDITFIKDGSGLDVEVKNSYDGMAIIDWFNSTKYQIEKIEFDDGTFITNNEINSIIQQMSTFKYNDILELESNNSFSSDQELLPIFLSNN